MKIFELINGTKHCLNISEKNKKLGPIPSVSLPRVTTCHHCHECGCDKGCYMNKGIYERDAMRTYRENLAFFNADPEKYFEKIANYCKLVNYFRWNVCGDVPNNVYWQGIVNTAVECPNCNFLIFTKNYEIVNAYVKNGGEIPKNLTAVFSRWYDWTPENPYNFPTTNLIKNEKDLPENGMLCPGYCYDCVCRGVACWRLKPGETLYFVEH